ncbi:MAG: hypothetical protein HFG58_10035 [Lachnospiraceae bacterium]|jgi:hypothetical protein|nr:hypothetical protein [Lachnospiraceae bacterium]
MEERIARLKQAEEYGRKQNHIGFAVLAVLCVSYVICQADVLMFSAAAVLAGVLWNVRKQNESRRRRFLEEQTEFENRFLEYGSRLCGGEKWRRMACGYLETEDGFYNVMVFAEGNRFILTNQVIKSHFVFRVNGIFYYLLSMDPAAEMILQISDVSAVKFEKMEENHQLFLREKGLLWQRLSVVEGYIYQRFLKQMEKRELTGMIAMDSGIDSLRHEDVWRANLEDNVRLYVTGEALEDLREPGCGERILRRGLVTI